MWEALAPWITIAITVALSILVPLFTQIVNNEHQRKMQREKIEYEEKQKRIIAFKNFLAHVGGVVTSNGHIEKEELSKAGASVYMLYCYAPEEWLFDLDTLVYHISKFNWDDARVLSQKISRLISKELNNTSIIDSKHEQKKKKQKEDN